MPRRLLLLNVALGLLGCLFAAWLTRELLAAQPLPVQPAPRAAPPAPTATSPASAPAPGSYGGIATKNLFSPSRSEAPAGPVMTAGPRPLLHGVVMDGAKSRAYLEDPQIKRTFGYAVGDPVGGGRVESISADRVVIARADGLLEVLLQDPSKPKTPAPAAATPGQPAAEARPPSAPPPAAPPSRVPGSDPRSER